MNLFVLLEIWKGHVEKVWVTDDEDQIYDWRDEVDAEHGIVRDDDGNAEFDDWEVTTLPVNQYQITLTVTNVIPLN